MSLADLAATRYIEIVGPLGARTVVSVSAYAAMISLDLEMTRVRAVSRRELIGRLARRRATS